MDYLVLYDSSQSTNLFKQWRLEWLPIFNVTLRTAHYVGAYNSKRYTSNVISVLYIYHDASAAFQGGFCHFRSLNSNLFKLRNQNIFKTIQFLSVLCLMTIKSVETDGEVWRKFCKKLSFYNLGRIPNIKKEKQTHFIQDIEGILYD